MHAMPPSCWRAFTAQKVLLGSATPSTESWFQAQQGVYGLVSFAHAFLNRHCPKLNCETGPRAKQKSMKRVLSSAMYQSNWCSSRKEQVILFSKPKAILLLLNARIVDMFRSASIAQLVLRIINSKHLLIVIIVTGYHEAMLKGLSICHAMAHVLIAMGSAPKTGGGN